jgi:hypothetical protein
VHRDGLEFSISVIIRNKNVRASQGSRLFLVVYSSQEVYSCQEVSTHYFLLACLVHFVADGGQANNNQDPDCYTYS